jgi:hypothetical protein
MKKLIPTYVLSFIIAFMLYIVEPITMFVSNRNDFNFNLSNFIKPLLLFFFIIFLGLSLIYTIIYLINKKVSKKLLFFNVVVIISYVLFFWFYIEGNYLSSTLPTLNGEAIDWSNYNTENIISIIILIGLIVTYIICCRKFKYEKVIKVSNYVTLSVFVMLFVSFIPSLINSDLYLNKKVILVSNHNINNISNNKNFFIFLLDAVDSKYYKEALDESKYKDLFNDFTYYPDTLTMYPFTRDAIPHLLSGKVNYNEEEFVKYYNDAMDSSPFIDKLHELNYDINLYEQDIKWNTDKSKMVLNLTDYNDSFANRCYFFQETKYILFKYLPHFLKQYSRIDYFDINSCKVDYNDEGFSLFDDRFNKYINNNELKEVSKNQFSFIHLDGAHAPFDLDENLERIKDGTYMQKVKASLKVTYNYINRIRKSGLYDNSVIIVMADHGYGEGDKWQHRTNPILFIKGINEHHDMMISDKAISYDDLIEAYLDLLNDKKSNELFPNITSDRERKFIWYRYEEEDHMEEYVASGKAWDFDSMKKTGVEFNR